MGKILTVSVAAYNVEKYIRECLDCFIFPEILDKIEVMIINDGSSDNTQIIAEEYQNNYPNTFRVINKENGGWGSTVNTGIEYANGKYFKQLDGDDYFDKNTIINFIHLLEIHNEDLIYTNYLSFDDETGEIIDNINVHDELSQKNIKLKDVAFDFTIAMHACTFKTDILKKKEMSITEHCFYTDIEYMLKALVRVQEVYFAPINVYCYRLGRMGQSASIEGLRKHYKEHIKIVYKLLYFYNNLNECEEIKKIVYDRILLMIDYQYYIFMNLKPNGAHALEMKKFDQKIKINYPNFYNTNRNRVKVFRLIGRLSYPFIVYRK